MVKQSIAVIALITTVVGSGVFPVLASASEGDAFIMLYYPYWQREIMSPSEIGWDKITHIMAGPVVPRPDGSINTEFGTVGSRTGERWMEEIAETAKEEGVTPVLFVGGASGVDQWQGAASSKNRATFARNLVDAAHEYGYEGIDLDWEPLRRSDYIPLAALAREIRKLDPDLILTLPVGYVNDGTTIPATFKTVTRQFDRVNIMTYDMAGAWPGWKSWHHSALSGETDTTPSSIESSVEAYLDAGVSKRILGIGIPQYGYCWNGPKKPGQEVTSAPRPVSYLAIMEDYYKRSARKWDSRAETPYLSFRKPTGDGNCTFISYIDEEAAEERAKYIKKEGLGGAIVWSASQAYLPEKRGDKQHPILSALAEELR